MKLESSSENKKREFRRYLNYVENLDRLRIRYSELCSKMETVKTPNYSGLPRGGVPMTIEDLICQKEDLEHRIEALQNRVRDIRREITTQIDRLENAREAEILEALFVDGKSIPEIASQMGFSDRYIYALYARAIESLMELCS